MLYDKNYIRISNEFYIHPVDEKAYQIFKLNPDIAFHSIKFTLLMVDPNTGDKITSAFINPNKKKLSSMKVEDIYHQIGYIKAFINLCTVLFDIDTIEVSKKNEFLIEAYKECRFFENKDMEPDDKEFNIIMKMV
mgnify:CR=1 FL=1